MIYTKLNQNNYEKIQNHDHHPESSYYYWLSLRWCPITTIIIFNFIKISSIIYLSTIISTCFAQDYDVSEIQCSFASQQLGSSSSSSSSSSNNNNNVGADSIMAKLKKPLGFKGSPLFADDRLVNPELDRLCSIKQDLNDPGEQSYDLKILDFSKCGVLKRNGFVHVRIWFPQFPGVVMQSDQELIIMCKPPEPTVIQNKAAGFAGSFPHGARVSGVVEESPGRLEYEVALYKEAPPVARITGIGSHHHLKNQSIAATTAAANQNELPVDQAVPIGTKLQLRARISTQSVWKYVKLMEVSVSPDPDDPHSNGAVSLIHDGCRNRDFASIIPHQPARYRDRPNEVFLDFEAFLLSSMKERSTLWIHSQIKACMDIADCQPDFCLDLFEPSGHGRKKRYLNNDEGEAVDVDENRSFGNQTTLDYARFKENIEYTVILPGDYDENRGFYQDQDQCKNFILISGLLAVLLALSTIISCALVSKIQGNVKNVGDETFCGNKGYAGRAIVQ